MGFFDSVIDTVGSTLVAIGLESPLSRGMALGTIGFGYQFLMRPGISYVTVENKEGNRTCVSKKFALLPGESSIPTTYMPWYMWPLLFALIGVLFI